MRSMRNTAESTRALSSASSAAPSAKSTTKWSASSADSLHTPSHFLVMEATETPDGEEVTEKCTSEQLQKWHRGPRTCLRKRRRQRKSSDRNSNKQQPKDLELLHPSGVKDVVDGEAPGGALPDPANLLPGEASLSVSAPVDGDLLRAVRVAAGAAAPGAVERAAEGEDLGAGLVLHRDAEGTHLGQAAPVAAGRRLLGPVQGLSRGALQGVLLLSLERRKNAVSIGVFKSFLPSLTSHPQMSPQTSFSLIFCLTLIWLADLSGPSPVREGCCCCCSCSCRSWFPLASALGWRVIMSDIGMSSCEAMAHLPKRTV